jgi:phosphoglucosamine mutase
MRNGIPKRLFGTDGIRARVGEFPFDSHSLLRFGSVFGKIWERSKILMGRDTRESGAEFESLICSGIGGSADLYSCWVIPTPGLSYIMGHADFDYGIMLTASHNPFYDNGIKIFSRGGEKISDEVEYQLEETFFSREMAGDGQTRRPFKIREFAVGNQRYEKFLIGQSGNFTPGKLKCVVDCANGATYEIAPRIFEKLGMETVVIHADPDGKNINESCGSTDLRDLQRTVLDRGADLGIAFDGDGDRVLFVDRQGFIIDGDLCLFMISEYLSHKNKDFNRILVGTVMTNLGVEKALFERGIKLIRTDVGDRFVYQEMKSRNAVLGGEKSGHIILGHYQKSGDGILTAIYFLKSLALLNIDIEEVKDRVILYPQVEKSIPVRIKRDLQTWKELREMVDHFNSRFKENARVVIRYSGTEPKIRLMMESRDRGIIDGYLKPFTDLIESTIGE